MKNIIISGTPGCGKTSVAEEISNIIDAKVISLNELAISDKFSFEYDEDRKTYIVDFEIFLPYVLEKIEEIKQEDTTYLIIESHFSDIIPEKFIDYAFILRCDPDELFKRLESKDYDLRKITENIQAEIMGNCVNYFIQKQIKAPIFEIDTTNTDIKTVANIIIDILIENENGENYKIGKVDWLQKLFEEDRLKDFFK